MNLEHVEATEMMQSDTSYFNLLLCRQKIKGRVSSHSTNDGGTALILID